MNRSKEPRELQFTSGQLVVVFVLIIALGAFIFVLGVSVGKKQARLAEGPVLPPKTSVSKVARPLKPVVEPKNKQAGELKTQPSAEGQAQTSRPATSSDKTAKSEIQKEIDSFQAQPKTSKASTQGTKPTVSKTQPKTQPKPAAPEVKSPPSPKVTEIKTKPAPAVPPAKVPEKPANSLYYIQVAAASQKAEGLQLAETIRGLGFSVVVIDPLSTDRAPYFRVRVGGYATDQDRSQAAVRLAAALNKKPSDFYYPPPEKTK